MAPRSWIILGALGAALGVTLGAFGAHGLPPRLERRVAAEMNTSPDADAVKTEVARRVANYETAVRYQMYHSIGLILTGMLLSQRKCAAWQAAGVAMLLGILIFSGLLYALVWTGIKILGAIVPIGGVSMIVGWVLLAVGTRNLPDSVAP